MKGALLVREPAARGIERHLVGPEERPQGSHTRAGVGRRAGRVVRVRRRAQRPTDSADRQRVGWKGRRRRESRTEQRRPVRVGVRRRIAVVRVPDRRNRSPEVPVVLLVPGGDQRVRRTQVEHCEQARTVAHVQRKLVNEPASDRVEVRRRVGLPERGDVSLSGRPSGAGQRANRLDLFDLGRVGSTSERQWACGTKLRGALHNERLGVPHPRARVAHWHSERVGQWLPHAGQA